jgi:hypothetical protein
LTENQVATLAQDLNEQPRIHFWITEYFTPQVYKYLKSSKREKMMKNSPFLFYPDNWSGFFESNGWLHREIQYSADIAIKTGRRMPMPWWARIIMTFLSKKFLEASKKASGYQLLQKKN